MKKYVAQFIKTNIGMETMEYIGLIVVASVLVAIIANVGSQLIRHADQYATSIEEALPSLE